MKQNINCGGVMKKSARNSILMLSLIGFITMSDARAATVGYGFDQISNLYTSSTLSLELSSGSYFGFGSFAPSFDPTTITQANILSTLRDPAKWFKAFETATLTGVDQEYDVSGTAATADGMYAYAILINDTLENVQAAISGSAAGISRNFGVFTYVNTNPLLRFDLPRDPAGFGGDNSSFSNEMGLANGFNNFVAVGSLGVVTSSAVALVPEPSSAKLLLVAALLALPWMRQTAKACKI
jgi:hypothetical protein